MFLLTRFLSMVYFEGILKSVNLFADPWLLCSTNVSEMYSSVIKCWLLIQSYSISIRTWFTEMCFTLIFISNFCIWPISNCKNFYFDKILYFIIFIATLNILRKCVYAEPGYESSPPDRKEDWSDVTLLQKSPEIPILAFFYLISLRIFRETTKFTISVAI